MSKEAENTLMMLFATTGIAFIYLAYSSTAVKSWSLPMAFALTMIGVIGAIFAVVGVSRIVWNLKNRKK
jgi:hypothetical protein